MKVATDTVGMMDHDLTSKPVQFEERASRIASRLSCLFGTIFSRDSIPPFTCTLSLPVSQQMLATRILPRSHIYRSKICSKYAIRADRRYFGLQSLCDEFLDVAFALPLPPTLPPYSTTIIIVTVATRLAFTLPASIWVRSFFSYGVCC